MKSSHLFCAALATCLLGALSTVSAQTPPPGTPEPPAGEKKHGDKRMGFLTEDEKAELKKAHDAALASDPTLKAEGDDLMKQREAMKDATPDQRKALMEKAKAHEQKLHEAMLKTDPAVGPILDKMAARRKEMMEKRGGTEGQPGSQTPPPAQ